MTCVAYVSTNQAGRERYDPISLDNTDCAANGGTHIIMSVTEFESVQTIQTMETLFTEFFAFDAATFGQLSGWALVTFIVGYSAGVISKTLRSH
ncbi:MAG: hypothetical protein AAGJ37_13440 [Pseudomonadota bacterium]